jgi:hypothetical protein
MITVAIKMGWQKEILSSIPRHHFIAMDQFHERKK